MPRRLIDALPQNTRTRYSRTKPLAAFTTIDSEDVTRSLARAAVTAKLAACVQIEKITYVYDWNGL